MLLLLLACADPIAGTWLFTLSVTPDPEACADAEVSHNYTGAYVPGGAVEDELWTESVSDTVTDGLFFGRIEASGESYVLILGDAVYPGAGDADRWSFSWVNAVSHEEILEHASGYRFLVRSATETTTTVAGTFEDSSFNGTMEQGSLVSDTWEESDTWSEEARLAVGDNGETPVGGVLVRTDASGNEEPANNAAEAFDCGDATCLLTVSNSCGVSGDLSGKATEFGPEDEGWVSDASQAAGG